MVFTEGRRQEDNGADAVPAEEQERQVAGAGQSYTLALSMTHMG